jgi:hypothetical protein
MKKAVRMKKAVSFQRSAFSLIQMAELFPADFFVCTAKESALLARQPRAERQEAFS